MLYVKLCKRPENACLRYLVPFFEAREPLRPPQRLPRPQVPSCPPSDPGRSSPNPIRLGSDQGQDRIPPWHSPTIVSTLNATMSLPADSKKWDILHKSIKGALILTDNELESISNNMTFSKLVNHTRLPIQFSCDLGSAHLNYFFPSAREPRVNRTQPHGYLFNF